MQQKTLTIIDADSLIFTSAYKINSAEEALQKCKRSIYEIINNTNCDYYIGFLTQSSHRYSIATTKEYKGNRKDLVKPKYFRLLREYLIDDFRFKEEPYKEADDLCISAYFKYKAEYNCIISSPDKDLKQIEANFYNPRTKKLEFVSDKEAEYNFYKQMITGDTTDNIVGIPGLGEVKATKLLESNEDYFNAVLEAYITYFKDKNLALYKFAENYLLLYLQRNIELNLEFNTVDWVVVKEFLEQFIVDKSETTIEGLSEGDDGSKVEKSIPNF